ARCHIVGAQLGGSNSRRDNLVPCWQSGVNVADATNPQGMTGFEARAASQISGRPTETMQYVVDPSYRSAASTVPFMFTMLALTFAPNGAVTWVNVHQLSNERVIGRRIVSLGN
ncbi:MAG TPA: DNA/RNA non-specific endonuclease, partial [Mycobacteriales bacterium]|nr:DNA/RNA non-specific endonuclease [Mycobacteriales bacterium]